MSLITEPMSGEPKATSASKPKREKSSRKNAETASPSARTSTKTRSRKKSHSKREEDAENIVPSERDKACREQPKLSESIKETDQPEAKQDDSSSLIVEVGDSPIHSAGHSAMPLHSFSESARDVMGDTPRETSQSSTVPLAVADTSPFNADKSKSAGNSRIVSRWMARHRDSVSAAGIFTVMASATEDEVEACYPSVSIVSGALRAGSQITPGADRLRGELEIIEQEEGEVSESKETPQQLRDALLAGAFIGSVEVIEDCLRKGADLTAAENSGRNILHYIATGGHGSLCKKVLKLLDNTCSGSDGALSEVVNKKDSNGWTPLLVAVCRGQLEVVEALLAEPAVDFNVTLAHSCPPSQGSDKPHSSAIHFAAIQGSAQIVKRLLDRGMRMDVADSVHRSIFHYIAAHRNQTLAGAFFASITSDPRFSPRFLLCQDVHLRDPLYTAVCYGSTDLAVSMIRILSAATNNGQLEGDKRWCLKDALLSHDIMSLSCVQVAHLRRNYEVIYKMGEVWPLYRIAENGDPETFVDALLRERSGEEHSFHKRPQSPSLVITETLHNPQLWNTWLRADLTNAERVAVDLVKRTLKLMAHHRGHQTPLDARHESQLMRSVRRCGTDLVLKSLDATIANELESPTAKRMAELPSFLNALKTTIFSAMNQREAQSTWKYIHAEGNVVAKGLKNATSSPVMTTPVGRFAAPTVTALKRIPTRVGESGLPSSATRSRNGPSAPRQFGPGTKIRAESASPDSVIRRQGSSPSAVPSFAAPTLSRLAASTKLPKIPAPPPLRRKVQPPPSLCSSREHAQRKADSPCNAADSSDETAGFCS